MPFTNPTPPAQSITIPTGATTGPRIVIGNTVPPELTAWAILHGFTINSVILEYYDTTSYKWEAVGTIFGNNTVFTGTYDTTNGVIFYNEYSTVTGFANQFIFGGSGVNALTDVLIAAGTTLNLEDGNNSYINLRGSSLIGPAIVTSSIETFNGATGANTTSSASFVNMGSVAVSVKKLYAATRIKIDFEASMFLSIAGTALDYGILFNGTDTVIAHSGFTTTERAMFGGTLLLGAGLAAGTYVIQARWRRTAGTGVLTQNFDDWATLTASEVTPTF
jgi:hypothetical protein